MEGVRDGRMRYIQSKVVSYLRNVAPDHTTVKSDPELRAQVAVSMNEARHFGVKTEAGFSRWSYMHLITGGTLAQNHNVHTFMTMDDENLSPDERVKVLMRASVNAVEEAG